MQAAAVPVHSKDRIRVIAAEIPGAENNARAVRGDAQSAVSDVSSIVELGDVVAARGSSKQGGDCVRTHDLRHSGTVRVYRVETALDGSRFGGRRDSAIAIEQKENLPAIAFDSQTADTGSGGLDGKERLDRASIYQADLAPLRGNHLRAIVADVDDGAAPALRGVRIYQPLTGAVKIHGVDLVGTFIVRERNDR